MRIVPWCMALALCAELAHARPDGASRQEGAIYSGEGSVLTVTLTAERPAYYVGEPVRLMLVVRNESEKPLAGFFAAVRGKAAIHWRRPGGSFARWIARAKEGDGRRAGINIVRTPVVLEANQEQTSRLTVATHGDGRVALEHPGQYEFKVITHPAPRNPDLAVESNTVVIRVDPVPDSQRQAFAEYAESGLGAIVQSAGWVAERNPAAVRAAAAFVDRYPHSPYAEEVRKELVRALRVRVLQNRASKEERGIYETLKDAEPQGQ